MLATILKREKTRIYEGVVHTYSNPTIQFGFVGLSMFTSTLAFPWSRSWMLYIKTL